MAKRTIKLSLQNAVILGNRILNVSTPANKAEIAKDNEVYKQLFPLIDKLVGAEKKVGEARNLILLDKEKAVEIKQKEIEKLFADFEKLGQESVNLSFENEIYNHLMVSFDAGIEVLIKSDLKQEDISKKILIPAFRKAVSEIEDALKTYTEK